MLNRQIKPLIKCHYLIRYTILAQYVYQVTSSKQFFITVYIISAPITYNYLEIIKKIPFNIFYDIVIIFLLFEF